MHYLDTKDDKNTNHKQQAGGEKALREQYSYGNGTGQTLQRTWKNINEQDLFACLHLLCWYIIEDIYRYFTTKHSIACRLAL